VAADLAGSASATAVPAQGVPIVGVLSDGMPYFAPIGQVVADDSRVTCHLCGRSFRSVVAHLRSHGWTKAQYCDTFGLERGQSLEGPDTRKLRSVSFSARLVFDPAVRDGSARGRARARSGQLTQEAASAARGRPFPEQRRQRSRTAMSASARMQLARANRERAAERLAAVAGEVARRQGYADIGQLVRDGLAAGQSLSAISRACGLNKDWMSRHLPRLAPTAAAAAIAGDGRLDPRWLPALRTIGFEDVGSYLRQRHLVEHWSVNAIAREVGLSFPAVKSALFRHGINIELHATKRRVALQRSAALAATLGVPSITEFIESRRAQGWTWQQLAAASGQPVSWLRRQQVRANRSLS
jgi:ROS/MUCR transcriptional regulator protein